MQRRAELARTWPGRRLALAALRAGAVCALMLGSPPAALAQAHFTAKHIAASELAISGVSDQDLDTLRRYPEISNTLRSDLATALNASDSEARARQVADLRQAIASLDEGARGVVARLVDGGFWLKTEGRDIQLDIATFGVIQHLFDRQLVNKTLPQLPPLVERRLVPGDFYALLFDREAMLDGRKQRFGSQFACHDGILESYDLEDPQNVDARRAQLGMSQTLSQYAGQFTGQRCR